MTDVRSLAHSDMCKRMHPLLKDFRLKSRMLKNVQKKQEDIKAEITRMSSIYDDDPDFMKQWNKLFKDRETTRQRIKMLTCMIRNLKDECDYHGIDIDNWNRSICQDTISCQEFKLRIPIASKGGVFSKNTQRN